MDQRGGLRYKMGWKGNHIAGNGVREVGSFSFWSELVSRRLNGATGQGVLPFPGGRALCRCRILCWGSGGFAAKNQSDFVYCVVVVVAVDVCKMLQTWQVFAVNTSQQLATANTSVVDVCTFSYSCGTMARLTWNSTKPFGSFRQELMAATFFWIKEHVSHPGLCGRWLLSPWGLVDCVKRVPFE